MYRRLYIRSSVSCGGKLGLEQVNRSVWVMMMLSKGDEKEYILSSPVTLRNEGKPNLVRN